MITAYSIKQWVSFLILAFVPAMMFIIGDLLKGLIWALVLFLLGTIFSAVLANFLLMNPFTSMLKGKGLIAVNMDSTGLLTFFNIHLKNPRMLGKFLGQEIEDTFDREAVFNFVPSNNKEGVAFHTPDGGLILKMNQKELNRSRFNFMQYPLVIWNDQIKSLVTKDFFSEQEKHAFAEHQSLHLNQQMHSLTSTTRDFARYIVETIKPKMSMFAGKGGIIAIIIVVVLLAVIVALFAPKIISLFGSGAGGGAADAIQTATNKLQTINPVGG